MKKITKIGHRRLGLCEAEYPEWGCAKHSTQISAVPNIRPPKQWPPLISREITRLALSLMENMATKQNALSLMENNGKFCPNVTAKIGKPLFGVVQCGVPVMGFREAEYPYSVVPIMAAKAMTAHGMNIRGIIRQALSFMVNNRQ